MEIALFIFHSQLQFSLLAQTLFIHFAKLITILLNKDILTILSKHFIIILKQKNVAAKKAPGLLILSTTTKCNNLIKIWRKKIARNLLIANET